jgi:hypothetical protein
LAYSGALGTALVSKRAERLKQKQANACGKKKSRSSVEECFALNDGQPHRQHGF